MMKIIKGIPASGGIAAGPAYIFKPTEIGVKRETIQNPAAELSRLESARNVAREQLGPTESKTLRGRWK